MSKEAPFRSQKCDEWQRWHPSLLLRHMQFKFTIKRYLVLSCLDSLLRLCGGGALATA
jgi:hypothetical protein